MSHEGREEREGSRRPHKGERGKQRPHSNGERREGSKRSVGVLGIRIPLHMDPSGPGDEGEYQGGILYHANPPHAEFLRSGGERISRTVQNLEGEREGSRDQTYHLNQHQQPPHGLPKLAYSG